MIANYHSHTTLCRHASGTPEEYAAAAVTRGLKIFGFSDHAPQWFAGDYYSRMRMYPGQLSGYCNMVRSLRQEYVDRLEIPLGLEVEYYPSIFRTLLQQARDHGVEYMILGQHWIGDEKNEPYAGKPTRRESILRRYCWQVMDAMQTGCISYVAHPDIIHYVGKAKVFDAHIRRLCQEAVSTNTPLELNFLGIREGRHYPNEAFWRIAGEEGCQVIFGIDAHSPESITESQAEQEALKLTKKFGLQVLQSLPLRKL